MASGQNGSGASASPGARVPFDAADDASAVLSADGTVLGWTRGAQALLGYVAAEVVGRPVTRLLAMPEDPMRAAGVAQRCREGMEWSGLIAVRHRRTSAWPGSDKR